MFLLKDCLNAPCLHHESGICLSIKTRESLYWRILKDLHMDKFGVKRVYGANFPIFKYVNQLNIVIPAAFLAGKSISMNREIDDWVFGEGDTTISRKGVSEIVVKFLENGLYTTKSRTLLEVRCPMDWDGPEMKPDWTNPVTEIQKILVGGSFGSMKTMQDKCIQIAHRFPLAQVEFQGVARDNERIYSRKLASAKFKYGRVIDRRFWITIKNGKIKMDELDPLPYRTDAGGSGEEAAAGGAAIGVGGAGLKRSRSISPPAVELEQIEEILWESPDGGWGLGGGSLGPGCGEWGVGAEFGPPAWDSICSGARDGGVDGLIVTLCAKPHGVEDIHGHSEGMGAACP